MDNCPYCDYDLRYSVLYCFDRFTETTHYQCPNCGTRMTLKLRWSLGNSLCGIYVITFRQYAENKIEQDFGIKPTNKEMNKP